MTSAAPASLRRRGPGFSRSRLSGRVHVRLAATVLPLVVGLAACSAPAPTVISGSTASAGSPDGIPAAGGQTKDAASPQGTAASQAAPSGVSESVTAALRSLVASSPQPSTAQIRESLSAAGFAPAAVEVSASRTPTGLAADAVDVGVLGENECVMAQLRSGTVATSVLPVLPNGRCFIGSVQR